MTALDGRLPDALLRLPQPMHLYRLVTGTLHYHLGLFRDAQGALGEAVDELSAAVVRRVPAGARVLDVGCGLGGTARSLAASGHPTVAIDPCKEAIEYARRSGEPCGSLEFRHDSFRSFARRSRSPAPSFGAVVMIEVLQHFPDLDALVQGGQDLLDREGTMIVADVVTIPRLPSDLVPFPRRGALPAAAARQGLEVVERLDLSRQVAPTFEHIERELELSAGSLRELLRHRRDAVQHEIEELQQQCAALSEAFQNGDLAYELTVVRV